MGDDELDAVVRVWLDVHHHELVVEDSGHMRLVRKGLQAVG